MGQPQTLFYLFLSFLSMAQKSSGQLDSNSDRPSTICLLIFALKTNNIFCVTSFQQPNKRLLRLYWYLYQSFITGLKLKQWFLTDGPINFRWNPLISLIFFTNLIHHLQYYKIAKFQSKIRKFSQNFLRGSLNPFWGWKGIIISTGN